MIVGLMVYFLMTSLGEMAANLPVSGSFATYGARYVDEGFGFALGWNYWYNWAVTIAVDLVAAQLVMAYWFPDGNGMLWSALFLAIMFGLNAISVKASARPSTGSPPSRARSSSDIAAGESENPAKNVPRAVRQVFWRILLFYVFAILVINLLIPYTDPHLLKNDLGDISVSPSPWSSSARACCRPQP
ncbi:Fibronectin type III domain-containing protein 1 [Manis javanica]|nr:Fibronectin type III domain-containing protein 1 [Manis javanica]